jgi:hypothetical protein
MFELKEQRRQWFFWGMVTGQAIILLAFISQKAAQLVVMLHSYLRDALLGLGLDALWQRLLNLVVLVEEGCAGSLGSTCTYAHIPPQCSQRSSNVKQYIERDKECACVLVSCTSVLSWVLCVPEGLDEAQAGGRERERKRERREREKEGEERER